jgi:two-component system, LuxR family, sensor kinase FixL
MIREINLTGAELLGQARRYLKGSRFTRFVEPAQRNDFQRFCKRLFESGKRQELEIRLLPRSPRVTHVLLSGVVVHNIEDKLNLCQVAMTDISARLAAENWRQKLIDTTQDAVIAIDSDAQIVLFNGAAERIFGYGAAEVVGKKVNMLMAEPHQKEHDRHIARYKRTGEKRAIGKIRELVARRKNGEMFPIELSLTEIGSNEEPRYTAFIRDISEKTKLQADLLEHTRLAAIGETAAQVAHEIANPLNGIAISIELLERVFPAIGDASSHATLKGVETELSRLQSLLLDFRDMSREPKYNRKLVSLNGVVEEFCGLERPVCDAQGIQLEVEMEPGLPLVFADGDRIKQVLLNLCKNAEQAMPDGGTLKLRGYRFKGCVNLEVCDTGCGIAEDMQVFRPFQSTKAAGSGLGLVIARQIVVAHGGTLTYTSTVGKGTTFFLSLPV